MKRFKIGEPIRFGVYDDGGLFGADASDFKASCAPLTDPSKKTEIQGEFLDDGDDWYWTPIFNIFKAEKYIIHIKNDNDGINVKQVFEVIDEFYESDESDASILI